MFPYHWGPNLRYISTLLKDFHPDGWLMVWMALGSRWLLELLPLLPNSSQQKRRGEEGQEGPIPGIHPLNWHSWNSHPLVFACISFAISNEERAGECFYLFIVNPLARIKSGFFF